MEGLLITGASPFASFEAAIQQALDPDRLLVSSLVEVPAVVGWLRPVVLMPVGALAGLAPEQIEALLAHELAHIRRHDYLVNVLQSVVEAVLFYHPAINKLTVRARFDVSDISGPITGS